MSWSFIKVGLVSNVAALVAAIQAEHAPTSVKNTLCKGVEEQAGYAQQRGVDNSKLAIVVHSYGHLDANERVESYNGEIMLSVNVAPLIDTPVEVGDDHALNVAAAARAAGPSSY